MGAMLTQWAPLALLIAVAPATFYIVGTLAAVKADVANLRSSMETLFADIRAELRDNRRDVADVRERVSALEAAGD